MQMWKAKNASHIYTATTAAATGQSRSQSKNGKLHLSVVEKSGQVKSTQKPPGSTKNGRQAQNLSIGSSCFPQTSIAFNKSLDLFWERWGHLMKQLRIDYFHNQST